LLALLLFALVFPATRLIFSTKHEDIWLQFRNHLLLFHNFNPQTYYGINPSFWSIAIEVQLYLLYPVLLALVSKFGWRRTMFFTAICELSIHILQGILASMFSAEVSFGFRFPVFIFKYSAVIHWLEVSPFAYWFSWSLGAFIADAFMTGRALPLVKSSIPLWFILAITSDFVRPLEPFTFLLFAVLTATVISKLLSGARPTIHVPHFLLASLRQTGIWSYSIYLLHQPILGMISEIPSYFFPEISHFFPETSIYPLIKFSCCIISWFIIMPISGLWYRLFELPSIGWGKRIIQK
jgi:peptidoglycan/LPS O-acetylase OafA/YrhL